MIRRLADRVGHRRPDSHRYGGHHPYRGSSNIFRNSRGLEFEAEEISDVCATPRPGRAPRRDAGGSGRCSCRRRAGRRRPRSKAPIRGTNCEFASSSGDRFPMTSVADAQVAVVHPHKPRPNCYSIRLLARDRRRRVRFGTRGGGVMRILKRMHGRGLVVLAVLGLDRCRHRDRAAGVRRRPAGPEQLARRLRPGIRQQPEPVRGPVHVGLLRVHRGVRPDARLRAGRQLARSRELARQQVRVPRRTARSGRTRSAQG